MRLRDRLMEHEGTGPMKSGRFLPYLDCCGKVWRECQCEKKGKLTIGYGRNLDANGLSRDEVLYNLDNDILRAQSDVIHELPWSTELDRPRFEVLVEMAFNLGMQGLLGFRHFLGHMHAQAWESAAAEMLDSKWATQIGQRAHSLADIVRTGQDPT